MKISRTKARVLGALLASAAIVTQHPTVSYAQTMASAVERLNIPSQDLEDTLLAIGQEFGVSVVAPGPIVDGKTAPPINGSYSASEALSAVLAGSGLGTRQTANGDFVITRRARVAALSEDLITETLVVTGSRIERTAVNSPAPIDIVTAEDIAKLGLTDTTEALRFTPALQLSSSLSTPPRQVFEFGTSTLDLRGLGTNRTLVLVNGRRHVGGISNQATVDVATIPAALIEQVEVVTGGGSSIYGADAVSGVVNYILKDDFEGVEVRSNVSVPTRGDGEAYFGALTVGGNFGGGRGNAVLSVDYNKQTEVRAGDRSRSQTASIVTFNNSALTQGLGVSPDFERVRVPDYRFSVLTELPAVSFTGSTFRTNTLVVGGTEQIGGVPVSQVIDFSTGEIRPQDFGIPVNAFFSSGGDGFLQRFQNPDAPVVPETERYSINSLAHYDFNEAIRGFAEAKYTRSQSTFAVEGFNLRGISVPILPDNPFTPQQFQDQLASLTAQPDVFESLTGDANTEPSLVVTREFLGEFSAGPFENKRETFRIVGGFEGTVSNAIAYNVSANYGRTDTGLTNRAELLPDRFYAAVDAVQTENGEIVCRSDIDPTSFAPTSPEPGVTQPGFRTFVPGDGQCAPLNIFAPVGELGEAARDFIYGTQTRDSFTLEQFVINATITGSTEDFFTFPGGAISYAAGVEYREEKSQFELDALKAAGLDGQQRFGVVPAVGGGFDVFEGFAEVSVPVLADLPFAKSLAVDASIRIADYSTSGSATSFAFGTVWQPIDDLRIRASFNRAIRAPNVEELFTPVRTRGGQLAADLDPCNPDNINSGSSTRAQNCAAFIPDLASFDPSPGFEVGAVEFVSGGNPDLNPEEADTFTVGFAYTPQAVPGLAIVADYYDIEITEALGRLGSDVLLSNCVDADSIENAFCAAITRDPMTGVVTTINLSTQNLAAERARGIDYQISYNFDLDGITSRDLGVFTASLAGTYLIRREREASAGFQDSINRIEGELRFPKHFLNFGLSWTKNNWSADYGFTYQSNTVFGGLRTQPGREEIEANPFLIDRPNVGDAFVHYLGGAYQLSEDVQFSLRVNNLFDREPFEVITFENPAIRPVSFIGRTVQLGVQARF